MQKNATDLETVKETVPSPQSKSPLANRRAKVGLSQKTIDENDKVFQQFEKQKNVKGDAHSKQYRAEILNTDADEMLQKVSKDLKLTDYTLSRIVTSGTEHFIRLKTTTTADVNTYRDYQHAL